MANLKNTYQIVVVGGGINGAGIAREATAEGYKTLLIDKDDYSHATTAQTSKLIHGGIRYLEGRHFDLVKECLRERKILLKTAPHLVKPIRIRIPIYKKDSRPIWKIRMACRVYDLFAGQDNIASSRKLKAGEFKKIEGLNRHRLKGVIEYSDAQTFDSRLAIETIQSAKKSGLDAYNYMELSQVQKEENFFILTLTDHRTGEQHKIKTRYLVNAAGPWVPKLNQMVVGNAPAPKLKYVRGIHLVIPAIPQETGFCLLPADGRVVFILPWLGEYTLIGTTESEYDGDEFDHIPPSHEEVQYLLEAFNHYMPEHRISETDVLHIYSGVRSLVEDGNKKMSDISREYEIKSQIYGHDQGYIAVYGGKLTTYRSLAVKVLKQIHYNLAPLLGSQFATDSALFPGAVEVPPNEEKRLISELGTVGIDLATIVGWQKRYAGLWPEVALYALNNEKLRTKTSIEGLVLAEIAYLVEKEDAYQVDDIILRRTKFQYRISDTQRTELQNTIQKIV